MDTKSTQTPSPKVEDDKARFPLFVQREVSLQARLKHPKVFSDRKEDFWMDGHAILATLGRQYWRPWDHCITSDNLTRNNHPPYYVRLRDDQVGHLIHWVFSKGSGFPQTNLHRYWSVDFTASLQIATLRDSWGPAYTTTAGETPSARTEGRLSGGGSPLSYVDPGLPPTNTSSERIMIMAPEPSTTSSSVKRPLSETDGEDGGAADSKRIRLDSDSSHEGGGAKIIAANDHSRDQVVQALFERIDTLVAKKNEAEDRVKDLEAQLSNEAKITLEQGIEWTKEKEALGKKIKALEAAEQAIQIDCTSCVATEQKAREEVTSLNEKMARLKKIHLVARRDLVGCIRQRDNLLGEVETQLKGTQKILKQRREDIKKHDLKTVDQRIT